RLYPVCVKLDWNFQKLPVFLRNNYQGIGVLRLLYSKPHLLSSRVLYFKFKESIFISNSRSQCSRVVHTHVSDALTGSLIDDVTTKHLRVCLSHLFFSADENNILTAFAIFDSSFEKLIKNLAYGLICKPLRDRLRFIKEFRTV